MARSVDSRQEARPSGPRLLVTFFFLIFSTLNVQAEKKVALVIGNGAYKHTSKLPNPRNDAEDIGTVLRRLGFEVVDGTDLNREQFERAIRLFAMELRQADVGLFYYAGHGLQVAGENFLVPVDAELKNELDLDFTAIKLRTVLSRMERSVKTSLIFIDACRNNPLANNFVKGRGGGSRGLAPVRAGRESLIVYSTAPGNIADDGKARNSPFTRSLLDHIETPGLDIAPLIRRVRRDVKIRTNDQQVPWSESSLTNDFAFLEGVAADLEEEKRRGEDSAAWKLAQRLNSLGAYQAYLLEHPRGAYGRQAQQRLQKLRETQKKQLLQSEHAAERRRRQSAEAQREAEQRNAEELAWTRAATSDEISGYENFLKDWPASHHASVANLRLAELRRLRHDWIALQDTNDLTALRSFVQRAKDSQFHVPALSQLAKLQALDERTAAAKRNKEVVAWTRATERDTIDSYSHFIKSFPSSTHLKAASARIGQLQQLGEKWSALASSRSITVLGNFVAEAEDSPFHAAALARLNTLEQAEEGDWIRAAKIQRNLTYERFLHDWPDGRYAKPAKSRLGELQKIKLHWHELRPNASIEELRSFIKAHGWSEYGDEATTVLAQKLKDQPGRKNPGIKVLTASEMAKLIDGKFVTQTASGDYFRFDSMAMPKYRRKLGRKFVQSLLGSEKIRLEGAFTAVVDQKGKLRRIEGIAGIIESRVDKTGSLFLMQMHGNERSSNDVNRHDRQFATLTLVRNKQDYICDATAWHSLLAKTEPAPRVDRCLISSLPSPEPVDKPAKVSIGKQ